jgi:hypothetical protein
MPTDPFLRDAIKALKQKIQTSASTATPEELAYLGTAVDRIGGRATVLEVEEIGDIKMQELTDLYDQLSAAIDTDVSQELTAFNAAVDAKVAQMDTATSTALNTYGVQVDTIRINAQTEITAVKNAALDDVADASSEVSTQIDALTSAGALAMQQALNASMYHNFFFMSLR